MIIGWNEWCSPPDIKIPAIKAKIDTGARTSCLHAFRINEYHYNGELYVRFLVHPVNKLDIFEKECHAQVIDQKVVTSSTGQKELRYFIRTIITIADQSYEIDLNLFNRDDMKFKMLIGREALEGRFIVDSSQKYLSKKISRNQLMEIYNIKI